MSTELAVKQDQIEGLVIKTNEALTQNQTSVERAKSAGIVILDEIEQHGMDDEMDKKCNIFLVKARKTAVAMLERRKPTTQLFDQLKKVFTGLEGELSPKTNGSVIMQIQSHRDTYAAEKAAEAERKRKEAERLLNIKNEKTEVRTKIDLALVEYFEGYLKETSDWLLKAFNEATIKDFDQHKKEIETFDPVYPRSHFDQFTSSVKVVYVDQQTVTTIIGDAKNDEVYKKFAEVYWKEFDDLKLNLTEQLPGKLKELKEIAEAEKKDKEEADRLKAQQEERERIEKQRLEKEAAERKEAAAIEAEQNQSNEQMQNMFEATPTEADNTAQVRKNYVISVTHQKGWIEIFNFWFLKEGNDLPIDKMGRKSLDQMKTFCQNYATKEGEKIQSDYLKYEETFKAVAKV